LENKVNSNDKHPRLFLTPKGHISLFVWIAVLSTGPAVSCDVYDNRLIANDDVGSKQPAVDGSSPRDAARTTGNKDVGDAPIAIDTDRDAGEDDAAVTACGIEDADCDGSIYKSTDADLLQQDATDSTTDSAPPPIDAIIVVDECPDDPDKTAPGICGCGTPDTDDDNDGTPNCDDACPQDNTKTEPGICGCGNKDPSGADNGLIYCVKSSLLHRYRFDGTGSIATDSVGSADGSILGINAELASGALTLGGDRGSNYSNEGYVELPTSIWDGLTNATFEAWVTWRGQSYTGSALWQRVFDFGDQIGLEGNSYLFLTPQSDTGVLVGLTNDHGLNDDDNVITSTALPQDVEKHLAVVVDDDASTLRLYIDGVSQGSVQMRTKLAQVNAVHCWLGRSNFTVDSEFNGSFHEFRIWGVALSDEQMNASFNAGPDYEFLP